MLVEKKLALNLLNDVKLELQKSSIYDNEILFIEESIHRLATSENYGVSLTFLICTLITQAKHSGIEIAKLELMRQLHND